MMEFLANYEHVTIHLILLSLTDSFFIQISFYLFIFSLYLFIYLLTYNCFAMLC